MFNTQPQTLNLTTNTQPQTLNLTTTTITQPQTLDLTTTTITNTCTTIALTLREGSFTRRVTSASKMVSL